MDNPENQGATKVVRLPKITCVKLVWACFENGNTVVSKKG